MLNGPDINIFGHKKAEHARFNISSGEYICQSKSHMASYSYLLSQDNQYYMFKITLSAAEKVHKSS